MSPEMMDACDKALAELEAEGITLVDADDFFGLEFKRGGKRLDQNDIVQLREDLQEKIHLLVREHEAYLDGMEWRSER